MVRGRKGPSERPSRKGPSRGCSTRTVADRIARRRRARDVRALRVRRALARPSTDGGPRSALELVVADEGTEIRSVLREAAEVVHSWTTRDIPEDDRAIVAVRDRAPVGIEVAWAGRRHRAAADVGAETRLTERDGGLEERLRVLTPLGQWRLLDEAPRRRGRRRRAGRPVGEVGGRVEVDVVVQDVQAAGQRVRVGEDAELVQGGVLVTRRIAERITPEALRVAAVALRLVRAVAGQPELVACSDADQVVEVAGRVGQRCAW